MLWRATTAAEKPLTIAIIDMDHFKFINDRCGHATGDYVLREFARLGREAIRPSDVLGRWGGEEFLLIMPDAGSEMAMATLERLRTLVFGNQPAAVGCRTARQLERRPCAARKAGAFAG